MSYSMNKTLEDFEKLFLRYLFDENVESIISGRMDYPILANTYFMKFVKDSTRLEFYILRNNCKQDRIKVIDIKPEHAKAFMAIMTFAHETTCFLAKESEVNGVTPIDIRWETSAICYLIHQRLEYFNKYPI